MTNTEGFKNKKVKTWWKFPSSGWPPPLPMMENIFLIFWALDHFLRKSFENCILPPKMSNTCKKNFNAFLHHLEPIQKLSNSMMEWSWPTPPLDGNFHHVFTFLFFNPSLMTFVWPCIVKLIFLMQYFTQLFTRIN